MNWLDVLVRGLLIPAFGVLAAWRLPRELKELWEELMRGGPGWKW